MHNRALNVYESFLYILNSIGIWFWDTLEFLLDIMLEFLVRSIDLALVIFNLIFQVIIFLRDLCIETMQTFANVFRGIINIISSIDTDDVEDFASACIVVILWIGLGKFLLGTFNKSYSPYNPLSLLKIFSRRKDKLEPISVIHSDTWLKTSRRKPYGPRKRRNNTRC